MMTVWLAIGVAALAFASGVAGLYLQNLLPEPHSVDRSRDMIGAIVGLVSAAAAVDAGAIEQTRLLISLQLASPISWPLVVIVVSWALILFCGFGLLSHVNATTLAALRLALSRSAAHCS